MKKTIIAGASALVLFSIIFTVNSGTQPNAMETEAIETFNAMADDVTSGNDDTSRIEFKADDLEQSAMMAAETPSPAPSPAQTPAASPKPSAKATPKATPKSTPKATPKATTTAAPKTTSSPAPTTTAATGTASKIIETAKTYLGVPYVWGGTSPSGFDCSGFIQYVYQKHGINLPRVTSDQYTAGTSVSKSNLKPGDLVFFETYKPGPSHVGIYLGNNQFIHASSGQEKVMISNLTSTYYTQHYIGARSVIK